MLFTLTPSAWPEGYGEALLPLDDAKAWLRLDGDDEDALVGVLRDASINAVEQYANLKLAPVSDQVATFEEFGERMRIGIGPVATFAVTAIRYVDLNGEPGAIDAGGWRIDRAGGLMPAVGTTWPAGASAVEVTYSAGYPAAACPPALIQAARMMLAHLYRNRAAITVGSSAAALELPLGFTMLCDQYRMPVI